MVEVDFKKKCLSLDEVRGTSFKKTSGALRGLTDQKRAQPDEPFAR